MNIFRSRILSGGTQDEALLQVRKKRTNRSPGENLKGVAIARSEARIVDHRDGDRHRLTTETVVLNCAIGEFEARLINLSGGGAMIEVPVDLPMWEPVELLLGERGAVDCVVRWIRDGRTGLEFAHETRLDCSREERDLLLRDVLRRNFPDEIALPPTEPEPRIERPAAAPLASADRSGREPRHPLIWSGWIHHNHESTPVRLRNISAAGAQVDCPATVAVDEKLLLDLDSAGTIFAEVMWVRGDQVGLRFETPFDIRALARKRPDVAGENWEQPTYLRETGASSPWANHWERRSISELKAELEGFLKR